MHLIFGCIYIYVLWTKPVTRWRQIQVCCHRLEITDYKLGKSATRLQVGVYFRGWHIHTVIGCYAERCSFSIFRRQPLFKSEASWSIGFLCDRVRGSPQTLGVSRRCKKRELFFTFSKKAAVFGCRDNHNSSACLSSFWVCLQRWRQVSDYPGLN